MKPSVLEVEQWVPRPPEEVFPFFADARNLERITPAWLGFTVVSPGPIDMREGAVIDYRLRIRGLPIRWRTRILDWSPPHRFIDDQVRGPYRHWRHTHTFEPHDGGTICRDRVEYRAPLHPLVNRLLVRPDIERIFAFRRRALAEIFEATFPPRTASPATPR